MAETYCGKNCDMCSLRAELNCPGCKTGPGNYYGGDCSIMKCCKEKGHNACETCGFKTNCGTFQNRGQMANWRRDRIESDAMQKQRTAERSIILGKWISVLFWLVIPSTIASIMGNDRLQEYAPVVYLIGTSLKAMVSIIYGAILLRLSAVEDSYKSAGVCILFCSLMDILLVVFSTIGITAEVSELSLLISIPEVIVALIATYKEYQAHSYVLSGVDDVLSRDWSLLWKWFVGCMLTMLGSLVLGFIAPLLAILIVLAAGIGIIIINITKLVFLYKTAAAFRHYR